MSILTGAMFAFVAVMLLLLPREPEFDGRRLSEWLKDIEPQYDMLERDPQRRGFLIPERHQRATQAIQGIGTNAVPFLIEMLETRDSRWKRIWNRQTARFSWIKYRFPSAETLHRNALNGLWSLGPLAEPALPTLEKALDQNANFNNGMVAFNLGAIGPPAFQVLSNMALNSPNDAARMNALYSLCRAYPTNRTEEVIPLLLQSLSTDPNEGLKIYAAILLSNKNADEARVVPFLLKGMEFPENDMRANSVRALLNYPDSLREHRARIDALAKDRDTIARNAALEVLAQLEVIAE